MLLEAFRDGGIIRNQSRILSVQQGLLGCQIVVCFEYATGAGKEVCHRIEAEETIAGLRVRHLGRSQAFDSMQDATVHGEAVRDQQRCKRTIPGARIRTATGARPIPDQISRCHLVHGRPH